MTSWLERIDEGLFKISRSMGPPWGAVLRVLYYPFALIRDWLGGDINIRAMSLAYTTLLSLVPLLVFSFAILRRLGARGDLRLILHEFFRPLGGSADQLTGIVMQFVANMRGELLGSLGLGFLVYTVITTIRKVEGAFNFVWRVERPRGIARRFIEYLGVMILGSILLAGAIGLLGAAQEITPARWLRAVEPMEEILQFLGTLLTYLLVAVFFSFVYWFVPNTHVESRAALIGGATAGVIWALVGKAYTAVVSYSSQMVAVYTGFAIVLTTLIWVYLSWLILLIGAQLAFYVQFPQYLRHGQDGIELAGGDCELAGLSIMYLVGRNQVEGRAPWTAAGLAAVLDVPSMALAPVLARLTRGGLIVAAKFAGRAQNVSLLPGREPGSILLADILKVVRNSQAGGQTIEMQPVNDAVQLMREIESALRDRLGKRTLGDLIGEKA